MNPRGDARGVGPAEFALSYETAYAADLAIATREELRPGDELAGYTIESVVGHGGMGVVYRAVDPRLGRPVALKLIAPGRAQDARFRERFLVESQLAASLDHSNVVPVYEAGEAEGRLFIAMRFVEGTDLRALLARDAPLDPERALALVGQVAAALDAAHARGLVHRDVKPANVLVTDESGREHCYLSDFGLTRGADSGGSPNEPAHLSGTVAYTAPEQITGHHVTGQADVYSLACVLYECLVGAPPFAGRRPMAALVAHVEEAPPPLVSHVEFEPVLAKALAKAPSDRYATCSELVEEARVALGGRELPAELDVRTPLAGRETDLAWLREAWREAMQRRGHVVVVSGKRGMGKTRLAAELGREVRAGGGDVRYVSCLGGAPAVAALAEVGSATTPVLLVLDDLDAADEELLDAVRGVGGVIAKTPVLVLATSRTTFPGVVHRELKPLDRRGLAELAGSIAGNAAALPLDALLEETAGVPLRVHELVAEWLRVEASRRLGEAALRAAAGRQALRAAQADLTSSVVELQRALGRVEADLAVAERVCPYKGLASFEVTDADAFFGREQIVAELVARLPGSTLIGVVGASGSGKSSIVRAGLSAALASGALPGSEEWTQVVIRPGEHPLDELARARRDRSGTRRLLLVVDQLEEAFTLCSDETERTVFLDALTRPAPSETVVIAVRADFYGRFAALPALATQLAENHVLVGPMKAEDLRRAIQLPARRARLSVEPALADALVADVVDEPGGLPLLSTALVELWQHRDGRTLRLQTYRESGGVRGAVARIAEEAYAGFTPEQQETARRILLRLASAEGDAAVRRRAPLAELELDTNEDARRVVAVLTESRLVTVSEEALEVAHEALLREWPRLRAWLEEDAEGRRLHEHVIRAAAEWDESGRDPGELYRGARLAAALDWAGEHAAELNELERRFIVESQAAGEAEERRIRRTNRRLRGLLAAAAVFLGAAAAGGGVAVYLAVVAQRESARAAQAARIAQAREVAAAAQANAGFDEDGSILAAVAAVEITRRADGVVLPEALEALRATLGYSNLDYEQLFLGGEARVPPGQLTQTALVLTDETLLKLAHARVQRPMSEEECRFYLHVEACPRAPAPDVVGSSKEAARSRLDAAGFQSHVAFTMATRNPEKDGTVLVQDPIRGTSTVLGSTVVLVLAKYSSR